MNVKPFVSRRLFKKKKKAPSPKSPPPNFVRVLPKQKQKMDYVKMFLLVVISC